MLDEPFRRWMFRTAAAPARGMLRHGITPNQVTLGGFALGLLAAAIIATGSLRWGALVWIASRILDGYDGMLARLSGKASLFGGFLDISCDMLAYSAMAIAFAYAMPADRMLWLVVLAGYVMAITTTLALSSLLERADRQLSGDRAIQFTPGLAEGGETTIVYSLVALLPFASRSLLVVWITLLALTTVQRLRLAVRLLK
jgi:phosphatidylglycerophosphate synthase